MHKTRIHLCLLIIKTPPYSYYYKAFHMFTYTMISTSFASLPKPLKLTLQLGRYIHTQGENQLEECSMLIKYTNTSTFCMSKNGDLKTKAI